MKTTEEQRKNAMLRYYYLKSHHICVKCGCREAFNKFVFCEVCKEYSDVQNELNAEKRHQQAKARREKRIAEGLCVHCGKEPVDTGFKSCKQCREKTSKQRLMLYRRKKHEVNKSYISEGLTDAQRATLEKARKSEKPKAQKQKFKELNRLLFL